MIITRAPLRVSLGGGGTDLPSYYQDHSGFVISGAINKYVYITIHDTFDPGIIIKYSELERAATVDDVKHPIIREALKFMEIENVHLEISSLADIPSGTGLGSSGTFTVALLKALARYQRRLFTTQELAEAACHIEMDRLGEPIGKQDQYIAAFGGLTCFTFMPDGRVQVAPLNISTDTRHNLEDHLMMYFTGQTRSASAILKDQKARSETQDQEMIQNLHFMKELGRQSQRAMEVGDLREFARLMHVHWEKKRERTKGMSNSKIDGLYELARKNGALGGKLIGAGGGGFLMFYTEEQSRMRAAFREVGLQEVRFRWDMEGARDVL